MRPCCLPALLTMLSLSALAGCARTPAEKAQTLTVPAVVGMHTQVGYVHVGPPPWPRGNCFSLANYQDANMHEENFEEAVKKFQLETVKILPVGDTRWVVIVDERIPKEWLLEKPCSHCTPESLRRELEKNHAGRFNGADLR